MKQFGEIIRGVTNILMTLSLLAISFQGCCGSPGALSEVCWGMDGAQKVEIESRKNRSPPQQEILDVGTESSALSEWGCTPLQEWVRNLEVLLDSQLSLESQVAAVVRCESRENKRQYRRGSMQG